MKSMLSRLEKILPHGTIILSLMFAVFLILDEYNPLMQFVDNGISRVLLSVLSLLSILTAVLLIRRQRKDGEE